MIFLVVVCRQLKLKIQMELADRVVGFLLSFITLSIFTYYTFWVIILVSIQHILKYIFLAFYKLRIGLIFVYSHIVGCSAICRQWSLHPPIFPTSRIRHIYTCICWCGTSLLLMHIYRVCDPQVQKEEGMMQGFHMLPTHWILSFGCWLILFGRDASQIACW